MARFGNIVVIINPLVSLIISVVGLALVISVVVAASPVVSVALVVAPPVAATLLIVLAVVSVVVIVAAVVVAAVVVVFAFTNLLALVTATNVVALSPVILLVGISVVVVVVVASEISPAAVVAASTAVVSSTAASPASAPSASAVASVRRDAEGLGVQLAFSGAGDSLALRVVGFAADVVEERACLVVVSFVRVLLDLAAFEFFWLLVIIFFVLRIVAFFVVDAERDFEFSVELVSDFFELLVSRCKVKLFGIFLLLILASVGLLRSTLVPVFVVVAVVVILASVALVLTVALIAVLASLLVLPTILVLLSTRFCCRFNLRLGSVRRSSRLRWRLSSSVTRLRMTDRRGLLRDVQNGWILRKAILRQVANGEIVNVCSTEDDVLKRLFSRCHVPLAITVLRSERAHFGQSNSHILRVDGIQDTLITNFGLADK